MSTGQQRPPIDTSAYNEIVGACLDEASSTPEETPLSSPTSPSSPENRRSSDKVTWRDSLLRSRWFMPLTAASILSVVFFLVLGGKASGGLSPELGEAQLQSRFGKDYEKVRAIDDFLKSSGSNRFDDPSLIHATTILNQALYRNEESAVDPIDPKYFSEINGALVYIDHD